MLRRSGLTVLLAAVFVAAPAVAQADFSTTSTASVSVGTYVIPKSAIDSAVLSCHPNRKNVSVTVNSYARVDKATSYLFTLTNPEGVVGQAATLQPNENGVTLTSSMGDRGTWILSVRARVGTWVGAPAEYRYTCP